MTRRLLARPGEDRYAIDTNRIRLPGEAALTAKKPVTMEHRDQADDGVVGQSTVHRSLVVERAGERLHIEPRIVTEIDHDANGSLSIRPEEEGLCARMVVERVIGMAEARPADGTGRVIRHGSELTGLV